MSKMPEFVVTGVHIPAVHFWARVLVSPERLQQVKESILRMGQVFLQPGDVLQVDTRPDVADAAIRRALTVADYDVETLRATCLVAWNELGGDITIYGDDADHLAAIAQPVGRALAGEPTVSLRGVGTSLHSESLNSIRVGDVEVFFARKDREEPEDEPAAKDPDWYPSRLGAGGNLRAPRGTAIRSGRSA